MTSDILVFGAYGQVGWELQRSSLPLGSVFACGRSECDLTDIDAVRTLIRDVRPKVIINAAAHTAVDKAETDEQDLAHIVNGQTVGVMAEEAMPLGALFMTYSTDYVFDGEKEGTYLESDATNPLNVYGASKVVGEEATKRAGANHLIFRTGWVYGMHGNNFAKTILRLAGERDSLKVIVDQIGAPTGAELIADVTAHCAKTWLDNPEARPSLDGCYNLVASGETSWHGFASLVVQEALNCGLPLKLRPENIHPIPASEYPLPAKRPANSRFNTEKLRAAFGLTLPGWEIPVRRYIAKIVEKLP